MQTYEVHSGDSMDSLLNTLATLAQTDPEITLVVPAHTQVLNQVDNLSRLRHFAADRGVRLHATVADQVTLGLFRIMGLDASDTTSGDAGRPSYPAADERALAAEAENMNFDSEAYDRAVRDEGLIDSGSSADRERLLADAENMNFDVDELDQTLRAEGLASTPHAPATTTPPAAAEPAPEPAPSRSFFGRLKQMITPAPTGEAPADSESPRDSSPAALSSAGGATPGEGSASGDSAMSGAGANEGTAAPPVGGLEMTMPDWLREEAPPYVPERPAAAAPPPGNREASMPDWLRAGAPTPATPDMAQSPPPPSSPSVPAWMQADTAAAGTDTPGVPAWMQPEAAAPPATPGETQTPDWLRETGTPPAPPPMPAAAWGADATLPDWLRETDTAASAMDTAPAGAQAGAETPMPDWLRADTAPAPPATETRAGMEPGPGPGGAAPPPADWSGENVFPVPAGDRLTVAPSTAPPAWSQESGAMQPPPPAEAQVPDWLHEDIPAAAAMPNMSSEAASAGEVPDWLRETGTPAPPPAQAAEPELPDWLREDTAAPAPAAEALPPPVSAPPVPPVPPAEAAAPPAATGLEALGGPRQTPESITSAVEAAGGIDARTRSLLLFGMALVRLAPAEARAAAEAARRAGLTTDDLRLVVEMAQALGGGPSERLGRRILEG